MTSINKIQRINFVERERFGLTYRKMIVVAGVVIGVVAMAVGIQVIRVVSLGRNMTQLTVEVKKLKAEQEKIFKETGGNAEQVDAREVLIGLIDSAPPWSMILRELAARTPRSVWLTKLKSLPRVAAADPQAHQAPQGIELSGHADEAGRVAQFVKLLQQAPLFGDVILVSSKKGGEGSLATAYEFAIGLSVKSARGKGI